MSSAKSRSAHIGKTVLLFVLSWVQSGDLSIAEGDPCFLSGSDLLKSDRVTGHLLEKLPVGPV
ncbi:MAG: hypothetical protein WBW53_20870 [Terriglobales bacterium]